MRAADLQVNRFHGLNTVDDPMTLGMAWQTVADNIVIRASAKPGPRPGHAAVATLAGTAIAGAYATRDQQRLYLVDAGALKTGDGITLQSGLASDPPSWAELNDLVFMANGSDALMVRADGVVLPWAWPVPAMPRLSAVAGALAPGLYRACCTFILPDGRETGPGDIHEIDIAEGEALLVSDIPQVDGLRTRTYICPANSDAFGHASMGSASSFLWNFGPNALGVKLTTDGYDPIPAGCDVVQAWRGRLWAALYDPTSNTTAIFPSQPLGFHLFDLDDGEAVPGRVLMMAPTDAGLIIGTDRHIWARTADGTLTRLAEYGVVPGASWAFDVNEDGSDTDKTVLFWTQRGACRALPFRNLTASHLSVPPGLLAGGAVLARGGERHFIATLHAGGSAFNPWSTS